MSTPIQRENGRGKINIVEGQLVILLWQDKLKLMISVGKSRDIRWCFYGNKVNESHFFTHSRRRRNTTKVKGARSQRKVTNSTNIRATIDNLPHTKDGKGSVVSPICESTVDSYEYPMESDDYEYPMENGDYECVSPQSSEDDVYYAKSFGDDILQRRDEILEENEYSPVA